MKRPLSLITSLILLHVIALAEPISPRPLRKLINEAELIIQGKVIFTGVINEPGSVYNIDYALIKVEEVIQGKIHEDTLKVQFYSNLATPEPSIYHPGEEVIAFLDKDKKNGCYSTHAMSYGLKHFNNKEGFQVYKQRILEMQFINILANGWEKEKAIIEWMVRCATNKYTSWEGLYELSPQSYFVSDFETEFIRNESFLNTGQRHEIFDALMNKNELTYSDIGFFDIALGINDDLMLEKLKKTMEKIKPEDHQFAVAIMERILKLTGDIKLEKLYNEYLGGFRMPNKNASKYRTVILEQFKRNMEGVEVKRIVWGWGEDLV